MGTLPGTMVQEGRTTRGPWLRDGLITITPPKGSRRGTVGATYRDRVACDLGDYGRNLSSAAFLTSFDVVPRDDNVVEVKYNGILPPVVIDYLERLVSQEAEVKNWRKIPT